jgi:hypothetical protein
MPHRPYERPLPLSWSYTISDAKEPSIHHRKLPFLEVDWLYQGDLPLAHPAALPALLQAEAEKREGILLRGVPPELAAELQENHGFYLVPNGQEARMWLDGPWTEKRSLQELVRRGKRWGAIDEVSGSGHAGMGDLAEASHHAASLRYLVRSQWRNSLRQFVFRSAKGRTLAGLTLTRPAPRVWHTELWLRHPGSPVGIMEALITDVAGRLKDEGAECLSLGEVPFVSASGAWQTRLVNEMGSLLQFAYNAEGLRRFKAKFEPDWQPLYLACNHSIGLGVLSGMFFRSNVPKLMWEKLF